MTTPADAPIGRIVRGMTAFGYDLHSRTARPGENTVVSPFSVAAAFGMARAGAAGRTGTALDEIFDFPADGPHSAFNALTGRIVTTDGPPPRRRPGATRDAERGPEPPVVALANGTFVQDGLDVRREFLRTVTAHYGAGVHVVDFGGDATGFIDAWAEERTAGRITRVFDRLPESTRVVLANAAYLRAEWERPFAGATPPERGTFTRADGGTTPVDLMRLNAPLRYAEGEGWQAVELRYAESELAMWVLVPETGASPTALLSPDTLARVADGLRERQVDLAMPGWDFSASIDLMKALDLAGGDFSGIADGLTLDRAVHRATITVDEWGTEAAAVTGLAFPVSAPPSPQAVVRADHPFAFAVVHTPTRAPLFIGQVADPGRTG